MKIFIIPKLFLIALTAFLLCLSAIVAQAQYCGGAMTFLIRDANGKFADLSKFDSIEQHNEGKDYNPLFTMQNNPFTIKTKNREQKGNYLLNFGCGYINRIKLKISQRNKTMVVWLIRKESFGGYTGFYLDSLPFQTGTFQIDLSEQFLRNENLYKENSTINVPGFTYAGGRIISAKHWKKVSNQPAVENIPWEPIRNFKN